eukprot:2717969-Amphidinium_carterae.1
MEVVPSPALLCPDANVCPGSSYESLFAGVFAAFHVLWPLSQDVFLVLTHTQALQEPLPPLEGGHNLKIHVNDTQPGVQMELPQVMRGWGTSPPTPDA